MKQSTKTGFEILQVAVILGVLGDVLLRVTPWGLNVTLFNVAFAAGMIMLIRRREREYLTRQTMALFGVLIFFASMFSWRDSIELKVADTVAIVVVLSILFLPRMKTSVRLAGIFQYAIAFIWTSFNAAFAPIALLTTDIEWGKLPRTGWAKHAVSALRGVAIVTPLILIFGGLFIAADAVYAGWVQRVFNVRPEIVFSHVLLTTVFAWLSAGYLRGVIVRKVEIFGVETEPIPSEANSNVSAVDNLNDDAVEKSPHLRNSLSILEHINISDPPNVAEPKAADDNLKNDEKPWDWENFDNSLIPQTFTLGTVEIGVILGLTNLLFLSFVIVQVPYLFGGMDLVQNTPDFKLAEYARNGFGELVTVSALVLPILLASHWLIKRDNPFTEKLYRVLAGIQIALLFVIMASAAQRLFLLTGELGYGLTTIRLYPMILMIWLAMVFVWFTATVLRGARKHFAWGVLWSAFFVLGATHVLNPDEFIVKTNLSLIEQGREFDATYNSSLSDDAIPALFGSFHLINEHDQQTVVYRFVRRQCLDLNETDLRSWNYSRWQASSILNSDENLAQEIQRCKDGAYEYQHYYGY